MVQPRADGREAARAATIALADAAVDAATRSTTSTRTPPRRRSATSPRHGRSRSALGRPGGDVPVSGTKALYGHPLGASGAIEAAICALAIRDGWAPASVNLDDPDPEIAALLPGLLREGATATYRRVLSTSFGFGGLNAAARASGRRPADRRPRGRQRGRIARDAASTSRPTRSPPRADVARRLPADDSSGAGTGRSPPAAHPGERPARPRPRSPPIATATATPTTEASRP